MRRWLINVAKNETILIVAAILALISCFIVPPDADYKSYIHASTISQLICLMIVVCGFQRIGVFRIIGSRLLEKVSTMRGLVITLVALTFFSAMFITNDVALVTFVPFAVAVLIMAGQEDKTRRVLVNVATPEGPSRKENAGGVFLDESESCGPNRQYVRGRDQDHAGILPLAAPPKKNDRMPAAPWSQPHTYCRLPQVASITNHPRNKPGNMGRAQWRTWV